MITPSSQTSENDWVIAVQDAGALQKTQTISLKKKEITESEIEITDEIERLKSFYFFPSPLKTRQTFGALLTHTHPKPERAASHTAANNNCRP